MDKTANEPRYAKFLSAVKLVARKLKELREVTIVSHYDCDGIACASIMRELLEKLNISHTLLITRELNANVIAKLNDFSTPIIFLDLGESKCVEDLKNKAIILDHHSPIEIENPMILHLNPELFGLHSLSASCLVYLVAREISEGLKKLADLAIVGAIGDMRLKEIERCKIGKDIIKNGVEARSIEPEYGLRLFGVRTRAIHKALAYCFDPYIPGISGNESAAVQLLNELGIEIKTNGRFKTYSELSESEKEKLRTQILLLRLSHGIENPSDIFGNRYYLPRFDYYASELATIFNAFGRLGRFDEIIQLCERFDRSVAELVLKEYKTKLAKYLAIAESKKEIRDSVLIVLAGDEIDADFVSPIATIFAQLKDVKLVVVGARDEERTKFSIRNKTSVDVAAIARELAHRYYGEGGGHLEACGAKIRSEYEREFVAELASRFQAALRA